MTEQSWHLLLVVLNLASLAMNVAVCIRVQRIARDFDKWCEENPLD